MTSDHTDANVEPSDDHFLAESVRTFPWLRAALSAVAVLVVEYLTVALIFVVGPSSVDRSAAPITSTTAVLAQYGHILYNAHHVPTLTRATVQIGGSPLGNDLYIATSASVPPVVFFLIPVVALVAAGVLFERSRETRRADSLLEESALVGTGFTVGYLVSGVVGAFLFVQNWPLVAQEEVVGAASQAPLLSLTLVTFFLFPLVFVSLGAAAAYFGGSSGDDASTPEQDPTGEAVGTTPTDDDQA